MTGNSSLGQEHEIESTAVEPQIIDNSTAAPASGQRVLVGRRVFVAGLILLIGGAVFLGTLRGNGMNVGDLAPDFCGTTQTSETICLQDYRGKQAIVLFFYPKDDSPVCTAEACSFRDAHEEFAAAGAVVIGVSSDAADSHADFASRHRLNYQLIADTDGKLRKLFGVPRSFGLLPGRVTYVIDREGRIQHIFNSAFQGEKHAREALAIVQKLTKTRDPQ